MSLRDVANITPAVCPFTGDPEIHRLATHRNHVGFRADCIYFEANPRMHFAVRRDLSELDWLSGFADCPLPPLFNLVMKIDDESHMVEPMFRGVPAWRQAHRHGFEYADLRNDHQALALRQACYDLGGMHESVRAQLVEHNQRAALMRAFGTTSARNGRKVN